MGSLDCKRAASDDKAPADVIVDCHTHIGAREHFGPTFIAEMVRSWGELTWPEDDRTAHWEAMAGAEKAIVVAMDAPAVGMVVPNEYVSEYVASRPEKLIGFASVDPNRADARQRLDFAIGDLGLLGLKVGPIYQHFDPASGEALALFRHAEELQIPVLCHQGTTFVADAPLRWARPFLLDEVARMCALTSRSGLPTWAICGARRRWRLSASTPTSTPTCLPYTPGRCSFTLHCALRWSTG